MDGAHAPDEVFGADGLDAAGGEEAALLVEVGGAVEDGDQTGGEAQHLGLVIDAQVRGAVEARGGVVGRGLGGLDGVGVSGFGAVGLV